MAQKHSRSNGRCSRGICQEGINKFAKIPIKLISAVMEIRKRSLQTRFAVDISTGNVPPTQSEHSTFCCSTRGYLLIGTRTHSSVHLQNYLLYSARRTANDVAPSHTVPIGRRRCIPAVNKLYFEMANWIHPSCWKPRDVTHTHTHTHTHTVYKPLDLRKYKQFQKIHSMLFNYGESRKLMESEREGWNDKKRS